MLSTCCLLLTTLCLCAWPRLCYVVGGSAASDQGPVPLCHRRTLCEHPVSALSVKHPCPPRSFALHYPLCLPPSTVTFPEGVSVTWYHYSSIHFHSSCCDDLMSPAIEALKVLLIRHQRPWPSLRGPAYSHPCPYLTCPTGSTVRLTSASLLPLGQRPCWPALTTVLLPKCSPSWDSE